MSLPPFLRIGDDCAGESFALRVLRARGEDRWWWTPGGERALDVALAAATGRRWPAYALAARLPRRPLRACWSREAGEFLAFAGVEPRALVSQLGTPGHYRKHAARLLDGAGREIAILKCSEAPASRGSIRAEAAALEALAGRLPAALPRALACADVGGRVLSLQTPVGGRRSGGWSEAHHELVVAMLRAGQAQGAAAWDAALARRERTREALAAAGSEAARLASDCGRLLELARPVLADLPLGWTHRDFTAANVWRDRGSLAVIDWEWAAPAWSPGHDLLHFHLFDALRRGEAASGIAARLSAAGGALARYCRACGIPAEGTALTALYLYDTILFYAAADARGPARAHEHPVVAAARALGLGLPPPRAAAARGFPPGEPSKVQTLGE